jgi:hypothetical protein
MVCIRPLRACGAAAATLLLGSEASTNAREPAARTGELARRRIARLRSADIAWLCLRCWAGCAFPTVCDRLRACGRLDAASASARRSTDEDAAGGRSRRGSLGVGSLAGVPQAGTDLRPARPSQMYQTGRGNICCAGSGKPLCSNACQNWSI